jgi:hypothetical protein
LNTEGKVQEKGISMHKTALFTLTLLAASLLRAEALLAPGSELNIPPGVFEVPVTVAFVTDLFSFNFNLSFDPTLLQLQGVTEGPFLSSGGGSTFFSPGQIDNTAGTLTFVDSFLFSGPGVSVTGCCASLAFLDFVALSPGVSFLTITSASLGDSQGNPIPFNTGPGEVVVSAIPEPGLFWYLAVLCAVLIILRRRAAYPGHFVKP